MAAYFGATFGVQTALLALAVAVVPLGIVIPTFLWLDRFESEPTRYLVAAFLWGALVAAVVAALFSTSAIAVLQAVTDPEAAIATTAVLVAPVVEEAPRAPSCCSRGGSSGGSSTGSPTAWSTPASAPPASRSPRTSST